MAWLRLAGAAWILIRADALAPREIDPYLSGGARTASRFLRLFAGRRARQGRPGERLASALEAMGPVAIKLGQLLSTRGDIFGAPFARDLAHLKDRLEPFPDTEARAEVERALGASLQARFAAFGGPVAAASLAQVHRARLEDGREVAVKVLRPGIEKRVAQDIAALALAARLVERVPAMRRLEPAAFSATVARALTLELDLRFEAAGADELRQVMGQDGHMHAPAVVWPGVARRVLTLEWAPGRPLTEDGALDGLDRQGLADALVRGFLSQALDHGVFHADLHEGNLFVSAPARLTVVDFGIVGRLGAAERRYLAEILWGFLERDYAHLAEVHFRAGYVETGHDRGAFAQALRSVGEPVFGRPASEVSMGALLAQLFEITAAFDMRLRPELVLLQKTMVTVEGVARRIFPEHDLWAAADPVVRRWIARELSPAARLRTHVGEALNVLGHLARLAAEAEVKAPAPPPARDSNAFGFVLGLLAAALIVAAAVWLRL